MLGRVPTPSVPRGSVDYFDSVAEDYADRYAARTAAGHALRERRRRVLELLGEPAQVLDVGCGPGVMTEAIVRRGAKFVGVDASPAMAAEGKRRGGRASFVAGDAANLPIRDASFDAALCLGVIDRLPDRVRALSELARVVRPGGSVVVSFPNALSPYAIWKSYIFLPLVGLIQRLRRRSLSHDRPSLTGSVRLVTPRRARRLVEATVGKVEAVAFSFYNPLLSPLDEAAPALAHSLTRRLEPLRRTPLRFLGAGLLVKASAPSTAA